jgi:hypothetical protein
MKRTTIIASALALVLAACGGKAAPSTTPVGEAPTGGPPAGKKVVDEAAIEKVATSTIALPAGDCQSTDTTLGALWAENVKLMGGPVSGHCDGTHCEVVVETPPSDEECDPETEDGCDGSNFSVAFDVDDAGAIVPASLACIAAG